jgi:hypothetical protein
MILVMHMFEDFLLYYLPIDHFYSLITTED